MPFDPTALDLAQTVWPRLAVAGGILAFGAARAHAAVRRRLGGTPWDIVVLAVATEVAAVVVASAMVLGTFSALRDWSWALAACAAFALVGRRRARDAMPGGAPLEEAALPSAMFLTLVGGVVLGRMLFSLRNPPVDWDSFHYHLPMVAHWMQSGTLGAALHDPPVFGLYFPGNGEVLQMWAGWAVRRETLMPWQNAMALGLLGLAVRRLGLLAGARAVAAEGVALCVAIAPGLVQLTLGTRVDDSLAMWFAVALLFAVRARRGATGPQLALMLLALGLLAGTKGTGPAYAVLVLLVAITGRGAFARIRSVLGHPTSLAAALLIGGYWMVRNVWVAGNPLYPAELRVGPWVLPGLMNTLDQARTSQVHVWFDGYGGHTTLPRLWGFYGMSLAVLVTGLPLWLAMRGRQDGGLASTAPRDGARTLFVIALACSALYLFGPFSGSYEPAAAGRAPRLNLDNLRLAAPALVAFAPLAAVGLSRLPLPGAASVVAGLLALAMLRRGASHLVPGMVAAILGVLMVRVLARRRWPLAARALAVLAVSGVLALAVAVVEPRRQRAFERAWDAFACRVHNLTAAQVREVRARAAGRPIALTGVDLSWAYWGRDFSGRPVYLPVDRDWREGPHAWDFQPSRRALADRARWLGNLARSGAAVVVVGSPGEWCRERYVEGDWCMGDSARFTRFVTQTCDTAYVVRMDGIKAAGEGRP